MSDTELLTAAAALIRHRLAALRLPADPARWTAMPCAESSCTGDCAHSVAQDGAPVATATTLEHADWILLMQPDVGAAMAGWLEDEAVVSASMAKGALNVWPDDPERQHKWCEARRNHRALAVARSLLSAAPAEEAAP